MSTCRHLISKTSRVKERPIAARVPNPALRTHTGAQREFSGTRGPGETRRKDIILARRSPRRRNVYANDGFRGRTSFRLFFVFFFCFLVFKTTTIESRGFVSRRGCSRRCLIRLGKTNRDGNLGDANTAVYVTASSMPCTQVFRKRSAAFQILPGAYRVYATVSKV